MMGCARGIFTPAGVDFAGSICQEKMLVLPVRIELTTSALPRMRSTTELRQHCHSRSAPEGANEAGAMEKGRAPVKPRLRGHGPLAYPSAMDAKTEREKRLAEALRANLRRRKSQARALETPAPPEDDEARER